MLVDTRRHINTGVMSVTTDGRAECSVNQSCIFRVVQVKKSLQDPLEVGNNLPGISDNVRE